MSWVEEGPGSGSPVVGATDRRTSSPRLLSQPVRDAFSGRRAVLPRTACRLPPTRRDRFPPRSQPLGGHTSAVVPVGLRGTVADHPSSAYSLSPGGGPVCRHDRHSRARDMESPGYLHVSAAGGASSFRRKATFNIAGTSPLLRLGEKGQCLQVKSTTGTRRVPSARRATGGGAPVRSSKAPKGTVVEVAFVMPCFFSSSSSSCSSPTRTWCGTCTARLPECGPSGSKSGTR